MVVEIIVVARFRDADERPPEAQRGHQNDQDQVSPVSHGQALDCSAPPIAASQVNGGAVASRPVRVVDPAVRAPLARERAAEAQGGEERDEDDVSPGESHGGPGLQISSTRTSVPSGRGGSLAARTSRQLAAARVNTSADPFHSSGFTVGRTAWALIRAGCTVRTAGM